MTRLSIGRGRIWKVGMFKQDCRSAGWRNLRLFRTGDRDFRLDDGPSHTTETAPRQARPFMRRVVIKGDGPSSHRSENFRKKIKKKQHSEVLASLLRAKSGGFRCAALNYAELGFSACPRCANGRPPRSIQGRPCCVVIERRATRWRFCLGEGAAWKTSFLVAMGGRRSRRD